MNERTDFLAQRAKFAFSEKESRGEYPTLYIYRVSQEECAILREGVP